VTSRKGGWSIAAAIVYWCAVPEPCVVLIGSADLLPALRKRAGSSNGELLEFPHLDALAALQAITERKPQLVALERLFAMTSRGAALINRIKADPSLRDTEIRVLAHDSDYSRIVPRHTAPAIADPSLDQRGTRRAPRFKMAGRVDVMIDGRTSVVVDLSTTGAQVLCSVALRPNQEVALAWPGQAEFHAKVAWTSFDMKGEGGLQFRAGIDFVDADPAAVSTFLQHHKA
jgi:PilZ domain-containing protein